MKYISWINEKGSASSWLNTKGVSACQINKGWNERKATSLNSQKEFNLISYFTSPQQRSYVDCLFVCFIGRYKHNLVLGMCLLMVTLVCSPVSLLRDRKRLKSRSRLIYEKDEALAAHHWTKKKISFLRPWYGSWKWWLGAISSEPVHQLPWFWKYQLLISLYHILILSILNGYWFRQDFILDGPLVLVILGLFTCLGNE